MRLYSTAGVMSLSCTTKGMQRVRESLLKQSTIVHHCLSVDLYFWRSIAMAKWDATARGFYCFNFTDSWD